MDFITKIVAVIFLYCSFGSLVVAWSINDHIDLPDSLLPYYFNRFPNEVERCLSNSTCIYRVYLKEKFPKLAKSKCWGYEENCNLENAFSQPVCLKEKPSWISTQDEYINTFYKQADFGYIRNQIDELMVLCTPTYANDAMLQCSKNLRFCTGRNILISLLNMDPGETPWRYRTDFLPYGHIGGHCKLNDSMLEKELEHKSALQSWAPELKQFVAFDEYPDDNDSCDIIYEKPVYIMKLDATSNMYHHFCDFFNLYASLHVNMTNPNAFDKDNHIILWETYRYVSPFGQAFRAFTKNPIITIRSWAGKNVCFKQLMLPLLPRMIFGLYYNTPIIQGCEQSGLFESFSEFMLHRLRVPLELAKGGKVRITFLERNTKFRKILNSAELIAAIHLNDSYTVRSVSFDRKISFRDQLDVIRNTDVLIGMHGAGLTHLLFLPPWATVFELYNCEDTECYKDLARLKGVNYMTWEDKDKLTQQDEGRHPSSGAAHAKFTNYSFDADEFKRLVMKAAAHVFHRNDFIQYSYFNHRVYQVNSTLLEELRKKDRKNESEIELKKDEL